MKKLFILFCLLFGNYDLGAIAFWDRYKAYTYYQEQDYVKAAKKFETLLAAEPDNLENLINMGHILYKQNQYAQAANYFERALQQESRLNRADPRQKIDLLFDLGSAHAQQEKWQAALDAYNELIKLDPTHARALKNIEIIKKLLEKQQQQEQQKQQKQEQDQSEQQDQNKQADAPDSPNEDQKKDDQAGKQPQDKSGPDQKPGSNRPEQNQTPQNEQNPGSKQETGQDQHEQNQAGEQTKQAGSARQMNPQQSDAMQQAAQQINQQRLAKLNGQEKEYLEAIEQNDQRANSYLMKMQMQGMQGQKNEDGNNW